METKAVWKVYLRDRYHDTLAIDEFDTLEAAVNWSMSREGRYNITLVAHDPFGDAAFTLELKHCIDGSLLEHVIDSLWIPIKRDDIPAWCAKNEQMLDDRRGMTHCIMAYIYTDPDHTPIDVRILRRLHCDDMTCDYAQDILSSFCRAAHYIVPAGEEHVLSVLDCRDMLPVCYPGGDPVTVNEYHYVDN